MWAYLTAVALPLGLAGFYLAFLGFYRNRDHDTHWQRRILAGVAVWYGIDACWGFLELSLHWPESGFHRWLGVLPMAAVTVFVVVNRAALRRCARCCPRKKAAKSVLYAPDGGWHERL